jgi:hypothetical protein
MMAGGRWQVANGKQKEQKMENGKNRKRKMENWQATQLHLIVVSSFRRYCYE